jgi:hypothetical protein
MENTFFCPNEMSAALPVYSQNQNDKMAASASAFDTMQIRGFSA